jgi:hypothetical protein
MAEATDIRKKKRITKKSPIDETPIDINGKLILPDVPDDKNDKYEEKIKPDNVKSIELESGNKEKKNVKKNIKRNGKKESIKLSTRKSTGKRGNTKNKENGGNIKSKSKEDVKSESKSKENGGNIKSKGKEDAKSESKENMVNSTKKSIKLSTKSIRKKSNPIKKNSDVMKSNNDIKPSIIIGEDDFRPNSKYMTKDENRDENRDDNRDENKYIKVYGNDYGYGYDSNGFPNYHLMTNDELFIVRNQLNNSFKLLGIANKTKYNLEKMDEYDVLSLHMAYQDDLDHLKITRSVSFYKIILILFFFLLEVIVVKGLKLNASEFTISQLDSIDQYAMYLQELGELSIMDSINSLHPIIKIIIFSMINVVIYTVLNHFVNRDMQSKIQNFIINLFSYKPNVTEISEGIEQPPDGEVLSMRNILRNGIGMFTGNNPNNKRNGAKGSRGVPYQE